MEESTKTAFYTIFRTFVVMTSFRERIASFGKLRYDWMLMLVLVSLIGFLMENVWSYLATGFIGNRGFIMPFLFVYGLIIFIIYLVLGTPKSTKTLPLYMIGVFVIFTALQIGYGYAAEALFDFRPWDLSEIPLSITPYASVLTSVGFAGLITLFMNVIFTPTIEWFEKISNNIIVKAVAVVLLLTLAEDFILGLVRSSSYSERFVLWSLDLNMYDIVNPHEVRQYVGMFFVWGVLGWCVETLYISWMNKKWTNRGFLYAPFCPIYGFGEFIGYKLLLLLPHNYFLYFFVGMIFCTLLELGVAKYMIWKTGYLWWDYTNRPFNYKGILCLESTIAWGVYAVLEFWFLHDGSMSLLGMVPDSIMPLILTGLIAYSFGDLAYSVRAVKTTGMEAEENNILKFR